VRRGSVSGLGRRRNLKDGAALVRCLRAWSEFVDAWETYERVRPDPTARQFELPRLEEACGKLVAAYRGDGVPIGLEGEGE
jgi:hypothetical protein